MYKTISVYSNITTYQLKVIFPKFIILQINWQIIFGQQQHVYNFGNFSRATWPIFKKVYNAKIASWFILSKLERRNDFLQLRQKGERGRGEGECGVTQSVEYRDVFFSFFFFFFFLYFGDNIFYILALSFRRSDLDPKKVIITFAITELLYCLKAVTA